MLREDESDAKAGTSGCAASLERMALLKGRPYDPSRIKVTAVWQRAASCDRF
jgi:hypothetical protein